MRLRNRFAGAFAATAVVASGLVAMTSTTASAVEVNGGCTSFFVDANTPITSTGGASNGYLGAPNGAWSDEATTNVKPDYTLTSSGGTAVGDTRTFSLTYDKGMKSFAPASGTQYWYFSVNGTMLPAVTNPLSVGTATAPGATVTGSYTISQSGSNQIVLEKMIFDATAGVRVVCNGQTGNTATLNPHTTPVATNVSTSFSAVNAAADVSITNITNQATLNNARAGDVISFDVSGFAGAGSGTAQICTTAATPTCSGSASFTVAANGTGSGTITVPGTVFVPGGNRTLTLTSNGEVGRAPFRLLSPVTFTTSLAGGGAGTVVTVSGTNYDPGRPVRIGGFDSTAQTANETDESITITADANGSFSGQFTVNNPATAAILGFHNYRMDPPIGTRTTAAFLVPGFQLFEFSGDTCTAKVGAAASGECSLLETVKLSVTAGDLKMSKESGDVALSGVTLNGEPQTATGAIKDVTVKDYRGGTLGWSLTATFTGLNGPVAIPSSALTITPSCTADADNNDDTVLAGGAADFATSATAVPVCAVTTGLGADQVSGGDTVAGGDLSLQLGPNQAAGNYNGTLKFILS